MLLLPLTVPPGDCPAGAVEREGHRPLREEGVRPAQASGREGTQDTGDPGASQRSRQHGACLLVWFLLLSGPAQGRSIGTMSPRWRMLVGREVFMGGDVTRLCVVRVLAGCLPPPAQAGCQADQADTRPGFLHQRQPQRTLQAPTLQVLNTPSRCVWCAGCVVDLPLSSHNRHCGCAGCLGAQLEDCSGVKAAAAG